MIYHSVQLDILEATALICPLASLWHHHDINQFATVVLLTLRNEEIEKIIIDLMCIRYIDQRAARVLRIIGRLSERQGKPVILTHVDERVRNELHIHGLDQSFGITLTPEEVL
jgi:anti-anti-sigma factor